MNLIRQTILSILYDYFSVPYEKSIMKLFYSNTFHTVRKFNIFFQYNKNIYKYRVA